MTEEPGKLDPEVKKTWVENLRSGKFDQGSSSLCSYSGTDTEGKTKYSYCCLGVLAHQLGRLNDAGQFVASDKDTDAFSSCFLLSLNSAFIGKDYEVLPRRIQESLATLNDAGKTFLEIADVIEKDEEI